MTDFDAGLATTNSSIHHLMRWFTRSFLALGLIVGIGCLFKFPSAVTTEGTFAVPSSAQAVQHREGGIIKAILVKDGELVNEDQIIAQLDDAHVISDMSILKRKLVDLMAEQTRLEAERDNANTLSALQLPSILQSEDANYSRALASQLSLLQDHRSARESQLSQLGEKKRQIETQIDGLNERRKATAEELTLTAAELVGLRKLAAGGWLALPRLRQSERDASRLRGDMGDTDSRIASARSQLTETEFHINETTRQARSEILTRLQAVVSQIAENTDQLSTASDRMQRLDIRAPRSGYVHELAVHTVGGTVAPGQALMSIIPNNEALVVTAKLRVEDIDQVYVGQPVSVRISSFKLPVTPELTGRVASKSPDQVIDEKTGRGYFTAKIDVDPAEPSKLHGKALIPGLPAEVYILGESRSVMAYMTQAFTDKLGRAFREK